MTCREVTEFLMEYLDRELAQDALRTFEAHIARCANCRTFLAQYEATIKAGQKAFECGDADASTVLPDDLLKAIMEAIRKTP
jgi:anti-sigma factor RsiW